MPAKIKVRIVAARDLPVMDRSSDLADAFAEVRHGNFLYKTDVCKKSLNPQWNSQWFRFEAVDEELQDEPLQIRIMDHDTVTAHDAIGKVNISLAPLLTQDPPGSIDGWFPIYDTMHGIRGEVKVIVKVDYFIDSNKFRQSSCGVQFFYTCSVPFSHKALTIHGFVEELVVNDDPEYQWIDKIRTPRSSNEARQRLFTKLSGELQRKIGLKVLDAGGNAVIGYRQCFDLEGEYGIVVRGIGTAVTLASALPKVATAGSSRPSTPIHTSSGEVGPGSHVSESGFNFPETFQTLPVPPYKVTASSSRRRVSSSDSDPGSESPPKDRVALLAGSAGVDSSSGSAGGTPFPKAKVWQVTQKQKTVDDLEFPFFTITKFPPGFLRHIGGVVTARSVKLLDKINHPDEPETRDAWWSEVRMEIRSHARALGCHAVIGYYEITSICDELIVLSASGTAACIDLQLATAEFSGAPQGILSPVLEKSTVPPGSPSRTEPADPVTVDIPEQDGTSIADEIVCTSSSPVPGCTVCHIPYSDADLPFPVLLTKCQVCRQKKVPDVIFSTIEPPVESPIVGRGCLLQARVCRTKKKEKGEANADIVSTILPFLEYELHQQLLNKLKEMGEYIKDDNSTINFLYRKLKPKLGKFPLFLDVLTSFCNKQFTFDLYLAYAFDMPAVYSKAELRYFRLAKGLVDHSTAALRKVFKREWNYLYPSTRWQNDATSGSQLLAEERPPRFSRLYDPTFSREYQLIKDHLSHGDVEKWDVTTLAFALLYSHALNGIRYDYHWRTIKNAIHNIREVRNTVLSHAGKLASISSSTFCKNFDIMVQAVEELLTSTDPLVEKLKMLRTETEFLTEDLVRYKQWVKDDHDSLLLLGKYLERLEHKMNITASKKETTEVDDTPCSATSENSKIISRFCLRMDKLEREVASPVDLVPSRSKPAIFRNARYIRLINESSSMSFNFRWKGLNSYLEQFNDDVDIKMFAGIQLAIALSHQSKKDESFDVLNALIPNALMAKNGVVLHARIKIQKAYILHDRGDDEEAMKEADEAEMMLSQGECHDDTAEVNYAKANIILSRGKNSKEDRKRILLHLDKCFQFCEEATVNKGVRVDQAKLRKALIFLGYYQHGILDEVPRSDVDTAETILSRISEESESLAERSKVYYTFSQSLLAYRRGDTNMATKLENKVRRKCELHKIGFEIQQLDMLRTLVRGKGN